MMNGEKDLASEGTEVAGLKLPQFPQFQRFPRFSWLPQFPQFPEFPRTQRLPRFPKMKQPLLCWLLTVLLLLRYVLIADFICRLSAIPEWVKNLSRFGAGVLTLADLCENGLLYIGLLFMMWFMRGNVKGICEFSLPRAFSAQKLVRRCGFFGWPCDPIETALRPEMLRYWNRHPMLSVSASGIEKIIAVYSVAQLDEDMYRRIRASAALNAEALKGRMKHVLLARPQKKAPIEQVTVVLILADQVEETFRSTLRDAVCRDEGNKETLAELPCVVDLERQTCTFDGMREMFLGRYPVKNRGIRLIKRYLFRGRLRRIGSGDDGLKSRAFLAEDMEDQELLEMSFWEFCRMAKEEVKAGMAAEYIGKEDEKRFKQMKHREIVVEGEYLYLKWEQSGIWTALEMDEKARTVKLDPIVSWYYPRARKIDKETVKKLKKEIGAYFAGEGCTVKYNTVR